MSISITWSIEKLECRPQASDLSDVVCNVHWCVAATDEVYRAVSNGSIGVTYFESSSFTPYNELNEDQVIAWVKSLLSQGEINAIEEATMQNVMGQRLPAVFTLDLPWKVRTP